MEMRTVDHAQSRAQDRDQRDSCWGDGLHGERVAELRLILQTALASPECAIDGGAAAIPRFVEGERRGPRG